jgi:GNAT superfamily N-acetyltransferase
MASVDITMRVRRADVADAEVLAWLESEARRSLIDQRGGLRRLEELPALAAGWATHLDRDDVAVVVGELDDVVVGWLSVHAPDDLGVATIESVFVLEGARSLGLGDALVEWALSWAESRSAHSIDSWALPGDRDTKNLFERNGLTARLITVSRTLNGPASSAHASR